MTISSFRTVLMFNQYIWHFFFLNFFFFLVCVLLFVCLFVLVFYAHMYISRHHVQLQMECTAYTLHADIKIPPPQSIVKVYMYLLGCKERSRVLPKHIIKKCVYCLFKGVNCS